MTGGYPHETRKSQYGYAICTLRRTARTNWLSTLVTAASLCSLNLLGFPTVTLHANVELDCSIRDSRFNLIAEYSVQGADSEHVALYWGHPFEMGGGKVETDSALSQAVNAHALQAAMEKLKAQLSRDASILNQKLLAAGGI